MEAVGTAQRVLSIFPLIYRYKDISNGAVVHGHYFGQNILSYI